MKLKAGSQKTPILIAHGIGGRANFSELAKHISTEHAIYGIQARGVDGMEEPFDRVEDMAAFYLKALGDFRALDSVLLIGYSFGGLIALEIAQRLAAAGQHVALLTLVDSYPHPRFLPSGQRLQLFARKIGRHVADLRHKPLGVALNQVKDTVRSRMHVAEISTESCRLSFAQTTLRVKQSDWLAMKRYRPRFYRGRIRFVRPETNSYLPTDPTFFWKNLAAEFGVETVPGDHLGMVSTHFKTLAAVLSRYVRESSAK